MRRIDQISRLRNCGVFKNFTWTSDLPQFERYNLIYGWNGSGKTTLSRLFRDLEIGRIPENGEVVLQLDGKPIQNEEFIDQDIEIRVFNREFITENVFPIGGGEIQPVFVLGSRTIEKQKELNLLKDKLRIARANSRTAQSAKETAEKNYNRFCVDRARLIKNSLRSGDQSKYNNYDKTNFEEDAKNLVPYISPTRLLLEAERKGLLAQHHATRMYKIPKIRYSLPDFTSIKDTLSDLMQATVTSSVVEKLRDDPLLADWVYQGLKLHQANDCDTCKFCEQPLPLERLTSLKAHFNPEYEQFVQRIHLVSENYKNESKKIDQLTLPDKAAFFVDLRDEFVTAEASLIKSIELMKAFFSAALKILEDKEQRLFEQIELSLESPPVKASAIEQLNSVIEHHNNACDEFESRTIKARTRLATDMIASEIDEFIRLRDETDRKQHDLQLSQNEIQRMTTQIATLESEIMEHRRPAEELNDDLQKYLGHSELSLEIKETGYVLTRSGHTAESLSEGEITAIALLYFLKTLQDRSFDVDSGVVVLDDPVSSLDTNALFLAFGFIRERTKDAGQLFVLTHNFSLFRQLRNWFNRMPRPKRNGTKLGSAQFFMLDSTIENGTRSSSIVRLDPLLEKFESEYHFLFSRIFRASTQSRSHSLEQNYHLPNMARRLLEAFLAFRQPDISSGSLQKNLDLVSFDEVKKYRILRFLHTYSHREAVGEPEHDPTPLAEGPAVLRDLLEMIKCLDIDHYQAMVRITKGQDFGEVESEVTTT